MSDFLKELQEAHRESPSWRLFGICHQAATRIAALEEQLAELAAENERLKQRLANHQRATNTVDAHETANVSDKPESQQEPVAWASVKDHPPEVGSKFVLLYDDGSGASLYFRHDSGYIDADGDECDALDENRMWAYLPAGFDLWCEGACEPITLPKWKGPSNLRPSEQAVTEAMVEAAAIAISGGRKDLWDGFDLFKRASFRTRALHALKAAMEAGG